MEKYLPEGALYKTDEMNELSASEEALKQACENGTYIEARAVLCDSQHNLHFKLGDIDGFMPHDSCAIGISDGTVRDIAVISRVNKPTGFFITGFEQKNGKKVAMLSRTLSQRDCIKNFISTLKTGDVIDAKVTHIEPFGAFCDIGRGITALLPINSISVSRIPNPKSRFSVGKSIKAVVRDIDENGRITLSHKELLGTWEENASLFNSGETVTGTVRSVEPYGIFVELTPNLAGLAEYTDGVEPEQSASVFIKSISAEKMKVKLIIVSADSETKDKKPLKYFISSGHIDKWVYSPSGCSKIIETDF